MKNSWFKRDQKCTHLHLVKKVKIWSCLHKEFNKENIGLEKHDFILGYLLVPCFRSIHGMWFYSLQWVSLQLGWFYRGFLGLRSQIRLWQAWYIQKIFCLLDAIASWFGQVLLRSRYLSFNQLFFGCLP